MATITRTRPATNTPRVQVTDPMPGTPLLDVRAIRKHFVFPAADRVVTNNAASTQPPRELLDLFRTLAPSYENVHRGSRPHPWR